MGAANRKVATMGKKKIKLLYIVGLEEENK
jgi:hypothetical protein